jgi:hypothetical protein
MTCTTNNNPVLGATVNTTKRARSHAAPTETIQPALQAKSWPLPNLKTLRSTISRVIATEHFWWILGDPHADRIDPAWIAQGFCIDSDWDDERWLDHWNFCAEEWIEDNPVESVGSKGFVYFLIEAWINLQIEMDIEMQETLGDDYDEPWSWEGQYGSHVDAPAPGLLQVRNGIVVRFRPA